MGPSGRRHRLAKIFRIFLLAIQLCTIFAASVSAAKNDANPCDNFYKYACENPANDQEYVSLADKAQKNVVKNLKHVIKSINSESDLEPFKKWQTFIASCKNTESINAQGITPLNAVLNNFGGWPLSNSSSAANLSQLQDILSFYGKIKVFPLFEIVAHDDKFHKRNHIKIIQPRTTFLEGTEKISQSDVIRYSNFIKRIIQTIVSSNQTEISQEAAVIANQIAAFEIELSKILSSKHETNIYKPTILKDFQSKIDEDVVNWKNIINGFSTIELVTDEDTIDVSTDSYYPKLVKLLQETPVPTVLNYVHWRFVVQYLPYTSDDLRSFFFENKDIGQDAVPESPRHNSCVFEPSLDSILSYQYGKEYITPEMELSIQEILIDVKQAAIEIIKESSLLKAEEKQAAENKILAMKFAFGISENAKSIETMSEFYNSWVVGQNYFDNILELRRFASRKELQKVGKIEFVHNSDVDFMRITSLLTVGFKYDDLANTAYIKPENLIDPLFSPNDSEVRKYGLLGFTIASVITMALGEDSIQSYIDGRFKKLYSEETVAAFGNRSDCFFNQFTNFSRDTSEDSQYGEDSTIYNLPDVIAIQIAYKALRSKQIREISLENAREFFTLFVKLVCRPELQEFSTNWSLRLSRPQYRVMGSLPNVRQFAEAFTCQRGVRMNPEIICTFLN